MSSRRIFIAVGVSLVVIISVALFFFFFRREEIVLQRQSEDQPKSGLVNFPSKEEFSASQENIEKAREIFRDVIQEIGSNETGSENLTGISFKNQKGNPISLLDFEKAVDVKIYPGLRDYLSNGYQLFYCSKPNGEKEFGVYLEYDMEKIYRGFTYDVSNMMREWEKTIFPDLHKILFPSVSFNESDLVQKINFRDGKYRYAEVNLPMEEKGSIQYENIEFGVIIAASVSCLGNAYRYYELVEPPPIY